MYADERQSAIAALVREQGRCRVLDAAARFEVSPETVRRDLLVLERTGLVRRVHGGAVRPTLRTEGEWGLGHRASLQTDQKQRIAARALELLPTRGSVLLDAGTTTALLATLVPTDSRITVLTHALPIATTLSEHPGVELHLLPGRVRTTTYAAVGTETVHAVRRLRVDVAVVATNAWSADHGLSTPDHAEAAVKEALLAAAHTTVVLADSSKLDTEATVSFGTARDVDTLVTDAGVTPEQLAWLESSGVEVLVA